jgi:hypothetical protein
MRPKIGEGSDAANPKISLAFQERIYLLLPQSAVRRFWGLDPVAAARTGHVTVFVPWAFARRETNGIKVMRWQPAGASVKGAAESRISPPFSIASATALEGSDARGGSQPGLKGPNR